MTSRPASPFQGGRIGRYELMSRIGEGGMGVVYLAHGPQGHAVALKVLRPHVVGDEEGRGRLAREVSSLRRVRSPRVAKVYDADPWGDPPFVVTEYVHGRSLHELVRSEGALGRERLQAVAVGLAEAIAAVHRVGVLHRDVKPSNVLVAEDGPVLIDFGLAKQADDPALTATGWLLGTPGYVAPETLYGDEATPAVDVHGWAATVAFAASGSSPFGEGAAMAILDRARRGEYDLSGVPADLLPVVKECLSPVPLDRPTAAELVSSLTGLSASAPAATADGAAAGQASPQPASGTRPLTEPVGATPPEEEEPEHAREPLPPTPSDSRRLSTAPMRALVRSAWFALLAIGLGLVPYVALALLLVLTWLMRTADRSTASLINRRAIRGVRRGDRLLNVLASPWHLLATVPGTLLLVLSTAVAGAVAMGAWWILGLPDTQRMLGGGIVAAAVWCWGPGSRRARRAAGRVVWRVAKPGASGWSWSGVPAGMVILVILVGGGSVIWWPGPSVPVDLDDLLPISIRL
ncbi:MAG: protein kinase [Propionibacteriales bacterium]|nr:protein kinase [Propionibacteriales bacterium]